MSKENRLPFENINPEMAYKTPNSAFMDFHLEVMGNAIFDRRTMRQVFRWEIYNKYRSRRDLLKAVAENRHPDYVLIPKETFNA